METSWQFIALLLLLPSAGIATDSTTNAPRPNFVLILADDMGFSDAGCYGGEIADAEPRHTGARRLAVHAVLQYCPLLAFARVDSHRLLRPGGAARRNCPAWAAAPKAYDRRGLGWRQRCCIRSATAPTTPASGTWTVRCWRAGSTVPTRSTITIGTSILSTTPWMISALPPVAPDTGYYSTTAIAQHAIDFLAEHQAQHRGQPFFLYLAFISPHFPLQASPQDIAIYRDVFRRGVQREVRRRECEILEERLVRVLARRGARSGT